MKLTQWFTEHQKPVRVGWYETKTVVFPDTIMRWWDGKCWRLNPDRGAFKVLYQARKWRGIRK